MNRSLLSNRMVLVAAFGVLALAGARAQGAAVGLAPAGGSGNLAGAVSISRITATMPQSMGLTAGTTTLYDGTTLVSGVSFSQFELNVPTAGDLHVTLDDLEFPVLTSALSFALVDNGAVLGVLPTAGALDLEMTGPGRLFAFVYAVGAPGLGIGSYYLNITHRGEQPVPLPASLWLLLSAGAWAGWLGRRRRGASARGEAVA